MALDPATRRAALIATAVTVPLLVLAAVLIVVVSDSGSGAAKTPGALSLSAPPNIASQMTNCTKVLEKLPVKLGTLSPRVVHPKPETPFVVAWGDPAVILRCGVDRPASLTPDSSTQYVDGGQIEGPFFDVVRDSDTNVFTTVDRAAYVSITVPAKYQGATVVTPLAAAIGQALPAVCSVPDSNGGTSGSLPLCTRRG